MHQLPDLEETLCLYDHSLSINLLYFYSTDLKTNVNSKIITHR